MLKGLLLKLLNLGEIIINVDGTDNNKKLIFNLIFYFDSILTIRGNLTPSLEEDEILEKYIFINSQTFSKRS
jgi:hypothetical protein